METLCESEFLDNAVAKQAAKAVLELAKEHFSTGHGVEYSLEAEVALAYCLEHFEEFYDFLV
jgi:hypothetical protein